MKKLTFLFITLLLSLTAFAQTAEECYKTGARYNDQKDYAKALEWYLKAANQGHAQAQNNIGALYAFGQGVEKSITKAIEWYTKAAKNGNVYAQKNLAHIYHTGNGVQKDEDKAIEWYTKAAQQGNADAQWRLGCLYSDRKDYANALKWYQKAADQDNASAQINLGGLYCDGLGVAKDYDKAVMWYRRSAYQGNKYGQNSLAWMYEKGYGVPKDLAIAAEWYQKSADQGLPSAIKNLARVKAQLPPDKNPPYGQDSQSTTATIIVPNVDKDIPLTTTKNPNLFAVVIGNEKYSKLPDVPYAENDARMFRDYCEKTLGVTKEHIRYLPNAGFVDIYDAVEWLKTGTSSYSGDASVIFYYAGHGLPDPTTGAQYLLPADVDGKNLNLTVSLQKLYDEFGRMPARSVAVFLDACFSGTNRDNQMVAANSGARLALVKSKKGSLSGKTIVFSATENDQTANPFSDQKHGFFTYFLLRKLQESKGNATFGEIADYVTKNVKRSVFDKIQISQTPSVESSLNLNDWRQMRLK
jgi:TPR repeat protein